jgi:hypothetical protein
MKICGSILFNIRTVSDKGFRKNTTHLMVNNFSENGGVYEIMWENNVEPDRPQMTTQFCACALHAG